ncbi:MAG TPA: creatininase family protein, partial [Kofleriaceae bacterium]
MTEKFLARHTTASLEQLVAGKRGVIVLVPVGSTEPHGPHLGLGTDVVISAAACVRATELFEARGPVTSVIAPAISYGVTDCAAGFPGAVSVPAAVLTAYVTAICDGLLATGVRHVCLVNNHLEPAHDAAIRAAARAKTVSVACPLTRK